MRPEHTVLDAERDAQAAHMRATGLTYRAIAADLGISVATAHDRVQRALKAVPAEAVAELRKVEGDRLDEMLRIAWRELHRDHVLVSHGRIVRDEDGVPVVDHGAKLTALHALIRVQERRAKMLGLDEPVRSRVELVTEDTIDAEIRRLEAELEDAANADRSTPGEASPPERVAEPGNRVASGTIWG